MKIHRPMIRALAALILAVAPLALHAEMVGTSALLASEAGRQQSGHRVDGAPHTMNPAREEVRGQLVALGVAPSVAAERAAALTDSQLQELSRRMHELPAGSGALGIVVSVLVIILLLEILGITDVSSKV